MLHKLMCSWNTAENTIMNKLLLGNRSRGAKRFHFIVIFALIVSRREYFLQFLLKETVQTSRNLTSNKNLLLLQYCPTWLNHILSCLQPSFLFNYIQLQSTTLIYKNKTLIEKLKKKATKMVISQLCKDKNIKVNTNSNISSILIQEYKQQKTMTKN